MPTTKAKPSEPSEPLVPSEAPELRDLLTVEQAAGYLQLSASSIRGYIRQGKLKAFRIAGLRKVLIPRAELLSLLEPTNFSEAKTPAQKL
jgi:excisionase family DNA binding protein